MVKKYYSAVHMDTVSPYYHKPIDEANGIIKSDGTTVLGSDDKAGIAAILEGLRNIKENNTKIIHVVYHSIYYGKRGRFMELKI